MKGQDHSCELRVQTPLLIKMEFAEAAITKAGRVYPLFPLILSAECTHTTLRVKVQGRA